MSRPKLLARQLRRSGLSRDAVPTLEQWNAHLDIVERTYDEVEQDRYTIERSLAISSEEMRQLYDDLKLASESALAIEGAKLRKSLAIHEAILEASPDGVLVVDDERNVLSQSKRFAEVWRLDGDDVTATTSVRATPRVSDPAAFLARVAAISASREVSHDEVQLVDGRVLDRVSAPIRSGETASHGRVWFFRDVTTRKQQEHRIRETNRFLDSIVENIPHLVFVKDAETLRFVRLNRACEGLLGRTPEQLLGKNDQDLFPPEQAQLFMAQDRKALAERGVVTIEEEPIETPRGTRWLRTRKIPILDDQGVPRFLLGISEDITDVLRKQSELLLAKEAAERGARAKSDFLLNMSHELRTPLNAILGFGRIVERRAQIIDEETGQYAQNLVEAAEHMLALVNDLLDLRGLEATGLALSPVEIWPVIDATVSLLRPLIDERRLELNVEIPSELPPVLGNERALVQILMNLISNAAKFTPVGGIVTVGATVADERLLVQVHDTGIGIAPEDQRKLFTYFEQVGGKHAHHMKGSGVGLALTRALVEKHGGQISVRSTPGSGSTFRFDLGVAP